MKPEEARAERARLEAEIESSFRNAGEIAKRQQALEAEFNRVSKGRVEAYGKRAIDEPDAQKAVDEAEAKLAECKEEAERLAAAAEGAKQAHDRARIALAALLASELQAFVPEADEAAEAALEALSAVEPHYREAFAKWHEAESKWRPLRAAIVKVIEEEERESGNYPSDDRTSAAADVPPFPLPPPEAVFGRSAPRPRALRGSEAA